MKNILLFMLGTALLISCSTIKPRGFTYTFEDTYTGLDTLINIDGFYLSDIKRKFLSFYMFYSNGIFVIANTDDSSSCEIIKYFKGKDTEYKYIQWGTYRISKDTIYTQQIIPNGWLYGPMIAEIDYIILPTENISNANFIKKTVGRVERVDTLYVSIGKFHPLESKRDYHECPWLKKKWFYKKK